MRGKVSIVWQIFINESIFRAIYIERYQLEKLNGDLLDSEFKGGLLSSEEHTAYLNAEVFPDKYFHCADEVVSTFNLCIYMHRQSCLSEEINQYILSFKSTGLLDAWVKKFVDRKYLKERVTSEPKVLVNEQLLGTYEVLVFGLLLASLVFLLEVCSVHVYALRRLLA